MWMLSEHTGKTERVVYVAKNHLRVISECRISKKKLSCWERARVPLADACYVHTECAHAVPT